ncbi:MAG TPA: YetF domain-containing protein [Thermoanaerobaculia bacterium]
MDFSTLIGSWSGAAQTVIGGLLAFAALVTMIRISGKRTVAKWNAFDLIVTVALGSTLATTIVSGTVPLLTGLAAFLLLIAAQFAITWLSVRTAVVRNVVKSEPSLLVRQGNFDRDMMRRERVTEQEVWTAARRRGFGDLRDVAAIVLETDGSFSVIGRITDDAGFSTLQGVRGAPRSVPPE